MKIELKNIQHSKFASEETHCFTAILYIDGKPTLEVSNDGHGGADRIMPVRGAVAPAHFGELLDSINDALVQTYGGRWYDNVGRVVDAADASPADTHLPMTLELFCACTVDEWLARREFKRACKTRVLHFDGKRLNETRWPGTKSISAGHIEHVRKKFPHHQILNDMPEEEAFLVYASATGTDAADILSVRAKMERARKTAA